MEAGLADLVSGAKRVALEYSPRNGNPYISRVDAGTVEVLQAAGVEVASSGDLIQLFEAAWSDQQWEMHLEATCHTTSAFDLAWKFIADELRAKLRIVIEERRSYDPYAAIDLLQTQAADRTLVIDTSTNEPDQVVVQLVQQLKDWQLLI